MKTGFWRSDWFLGIALTLAMLAASGLEPLRSLERQVYDLALRCSERAPSEQVAVIAIDEKSLAELGPWPWPRELPARLIDLLAGAQVKMIGTTLLFAEARREPANDLIRRLAAIVDRVGRDNLAHLPAGAEIVAVLGEAEAAVNGDRRLAESLARAGNVVLPLQFALGEGGDHAEPPSPVAASRLAQVGEGTGTAASVSAMRAPLALLAEQARAFGHANPIADDDGRVRGEALAVRYGDQFYPSLALTLAAASRDVAPGDIRGRSGESLRFAGLRIPVDAATRLHPFFYPGAKGRPPFPVASFSAVLSGAAPVAGYAGKIVLIGVTAPGIEAPLATPVGTMAPVLVVAQTLSSLLQEDFIVVPEWGVWVARAALLLVGLYLAVALPALGFGLGGLATLLLLLGLLGAPLVLLLGAGVWLPLTSAAALLLLGHLAWCAKHYPAGGTTAALTRVDPAEAERLHALALPGQGQPERAVDKSGGAAVPAEPPRRAAIGRYRLEKELGKGAMGIVYLGRDPQTGRDAAIKTLALAQEFDSDELAEVKQRFFREAETIARLDHPHIVALYEAGEEQDLAYLAMEFLAGRDLVELCRPEARLPLATVLSIGARVADALDYAHGLQVVHRDIKPANIMYEAESDQVKVTDFGIARITDSSRTKTGMVLGTPSYMSPEQLAGKKIDGRSDIYSLGVTLYQLCCGQLPFTGASLAQLMYKIANEPAPDIRGSEPALPPEVAAVIAKAMAKSAEQRYQRAAA
ncbi:MAG: serine/threonine-protein kinase, partial [Betaproteobacteria bacterium]|nr:serine/threonine-protein kinase [Betaproteobacteria bacterium]